MTPITVSFCGLSSIIKAENLKLYFPKAPQLRYQVWFVFCQSDPPSGTQNQSTGKWEPGSNTRNLFFWCRTNRNGIMALQATSLTETSWAQTERWECPGLTSGMAASRFPQLPEMAEVVVLWCATSAVLFWKAVPEIQLAAYSSTPSDDSVRPNSLYASLFLIQWFLFLQLDLDW